MHAAQRTKQTVNELTNMNARRVYVWRVEEKCRKRIKSDAMDDARPQQPLAHSLTRRAQHPSEYELYCNAFSLAGQDMLDGMRAHVR